MGALATGMIRMDHSHVMTLLHRYKPDTRPAVKRAIVGNACVALEMHAQLEEEVFYPAMREHGIDSAEVNSKNLPEHNEMRRMIARLRQMEPEDPDYDDTFMELMRDVMHHVADEETTLLHHAERRLTEQQLRDLGKRMTKRRAQLMKDYGTQYAREYLPAASGKSMLLTGGAVVAGAYALTRALSSRHEGQRPH